MKTLLITILSCITLVFTSYGQPPKKEQVQALKVARITQKLALTPEEAKTFWPVYDKFQEEMKQLRQKMKSAASLEDGDLVTMTDQDAEKMLAEMLVFKQSEVDLMKKYNAEFKKVLPVKKVVLLYKAEQEFKRELLERMGGRRK